MSETLGMLSLVVGIVLALLMVLKTALEIANTPAHRSTALKWFLAVRPFVPLSVLVLGFEMSSSGIIFLALIIGCMDFIAHWEIHPKRVETAYFVLFVFLCLLLLQGLLIGEAFDRSIADESDGMATTDGK